MKKTYRITGIDCANCAAKIERGIAAMKGVSHCSLNFFTQKLTLEAPDEQLPAILDAAEKLARKIEPGAALQRGV
ncbi:MAG: heavy-metal-associated domain-containing protein [Oscillospiraceae bacterium]|jgi:cation transport ATPase|nr:heavy-metal-associated domain-containing protein [Oscillospiraceae bacterium]